MISYRYTMIDLTEIDIPRRLIFLEIDISDKLIFLGDSSFFRDQAFLEIDLSMED